MELERAHLRRGPAVASLAEAEDELVRARRAMDETREELDRLIGEEEG
jgi:outer membrane protein TolC